MLIEKDEKTVVHTILFSPGGDYLNTVFFHLCI